VEDEGPGIPPEELADMPKRFFRGRRQTGMGTGLGLSIVDLALRRLGGTVSLQNRADGTGLAVTICLAQVT
jgi:two-component system sensor histidine kinase QseC